MGLFSDQLHPVLVEDFKSLRNGFDLESLRESRWLITGATGFVPAYLVSFLCWLNEQESLGMHLRLWVRSEGKAETLFPSLDFVQIESPDWDDPEKWKIPPADFVVHAASPATPACQADPAGIVVCNVTATKELLKDQNPDQLRGFLFFSSSEIYGDTGGDMYPDETDLGSLDPGSPRSIYPMAKKSGEGICRDAAIERGLPTRIARIFHTYGPGMDLQNDGRVFADFVGNAVRAEAIVLKSDGSGRRAFCYLGDTVRALLNILLKGGKGSCYNVGNPDAILSVNELADLIVGLVPGGKLRKVVNDQRSEQSASADVFPEIRRLRELDWQPLVRPIDGFRRTLAYYLQ